MSIFEYAEMANAAARRYGGSAGIMHQIPEPQRMVALEISARAAVVIGKARRAGK